MRLILALPLLLCACTDPSLNASLQLGPDGLTLRPTVSGHAGPVSVSIRP